MEDMTLTSLERKGGDLTPAECGLLDLAGELSQAARKGAADGTVSTDTLVSIGFMLNDQFRLLAGRKDEGRPMRIFCAPAPLTTKSCTRRLACP